MRALARDRDARLQWLDFKSHKGGRKTREY